jgi:hypothetical protein
VNISFSFFFASGKQLPDAVESGVHHAELLLEEVSVA